MSRPEYRMEVVHQARDYKGDWKFPDPPRKGETIIINDDSIPTTKVTELRWDLTKYSLTIFVEDAD